MWRSGPALDGELAEVLGVLAPAPAAPRTVREWSHDDVSVTELCWQTRFGPPTRAWLVRPSPLPAGPLPGLLALHCHAGVKSVGAERLITTATPVAARLRDTCYGGVALAERCARAGFAVLAHDAFAWGSRRFLLSPEPWRLRAIMAASQFDEADRYDTAAALHEETVAKFAGVMGTSFAGAVAHDDLTALGVLAGLPSVDPGQLGVIGFSGGGGRAAVLTALAPQVRASVIACMMSTLDEMFPAYLDAHSWLLATPWIGYGRDWPDVAFAQGLHDQLVLYAADDALFPPEGMARADTVLKERFAWAPGHYQGVTVPGPHRFDGPMQDLAVDFLAGSLST